MEKVRSRITAQGQISVPASVRKKLGIGPGSIIEWEEKGDDEVMLRRSGQYTSEDLHKMLFKKPPRPVSLKDIKEGIRSYIRKKHARR
ncbi:MAG: AbrB/MazE/SpoVT family DNA-binding domain-containing protein [Acidobacteria bacterium]|nr:AbrB/MazE/SpoVT family DNA-binding domain-containing protein [Acidobacteriota bacterium]